MNAPKRILLAEDDGRDLELTLAALDAHKLVNEVVVTRDGTEALDYLRRAGPFAGRADGQPAVVLLDLKMPKMDGLEVLRAMKTDVELREIPVVILTSSRESADLDECYRLGANAFVVKPVKFQDFLEAVKKLAVFWVLVNEPPPGSIPQRP